MCLSNFLIFRSSSRVPNKSPVLTGKEIRPGRRERWRREFPRISLFAGSELIRARLRIRCADAKKAKKNANGAASSNKRLNRGRNGHPRAGAGLICAPRG